MVFMDYGPKWKLLRKLSNLQMFGGKALENWGEVRANEVGHMVQAMYEPSKQGEQVVVGEVLAFAITNMVAQVVLSHRLFETKGSKSNEFKDTVVEFMTVSGVFNLGDFISCIAWMDLQGVVGRMKKLHKRFDALLTKMMVEHVNSAHLREGKLDFFDVLMANSENMNNEDQRLSLTNIKAFLMNLFTAGTDTSTSIIEWALAEMLRNPSILKKAQEELDNVTGKGRCLHEPDQPNLQYLQATFKETYQMHPSTPLGVPRVSVQACQVNGYYIPMNTRLNVNVWAIGRP
ncbi:Flavonoid 3'5'-hydroxylase [Quillaja saponaria]|uniref:Flavonoid 3'5'-hydroxylase n=1 Tax=Quillaja saponaria TaxID=32244 RepID=A0AAD7LXP3_QUISA|nr:Flavonoid 3'5'-hydroxylase [Quillaja saponaria]